MSSGPLGDRSALPSPLTLTVAHDGKPVTGLRPHLGVYAHLTAFHDGDGALPAPAARHLVPEGAALWAQTAPGDAASVRAFLAAGFVPVGAEALLVAGQRDSPHPSGQYVRYGEHGTA